MGLAEVLLIKVITSPLRVRSARLYKVSFQMNRPNQAMAAHRWPSAISLVFDLRLSGSNRRFQFEERRQLFIRTHNESLSVIAMRVNNEDCSPARIHG
jgi:hypothetical protein